MWARDSCSKWYCGGSDGNERDGGGEPKVGKILFWVVILALAYLAWRWHVGSAGQRRGERGGEAASAKGGPGDREGGRDERSDGPDGDRARLAPPESMMQCKVCGLHLPGSEAVFARGRVYCSPEHRESDGT